MKNYIKFVVLTVLFVLFLSSDKAECITQNEALKLSSRLSIVFVVDPGKMDYLDWVRMKELANIMTIDVDQTLRARREREELGLEFIEVNVLIKEIMEKWEPSVIRLGSAVGIALLIDRWRNMDNDYQRKAEMLALLILEIWGLKVSAENLQFDWQYQPFEFTLLALQF